jgi:hypothetical protein
VCSKVEMLLILPVHPQLLISRLYLPLNKQLTFSVEYISLFVLSTTLTTCLVGSLHLYLEIYFSG